MRAWRILSTWKTQGIFRLDRRMLRRMTTTVLDLWMPSSRWAPLLHAGVEEGDHGAEAGALGRAQDLHVCRVQPPIKFADPTGQSRRCSC